MRPNARLLAETLARRERFFAQQRVLPGTVSVHVRHGDKGKENALVPDEAHFVAARHLISEAGGILSNRIFVSTEDPATIQYFTGPALANFSVQYTTVTRDNHGGLAPMQVPDAVEEFRNAFMNLDIALEGDAMVCFVASCWCELMHRLKVTSMCKAPAPFANPSHHLRAEL